MGWLIARIGFGWVRRRSRLRAGRVTRFWILDSCAYSPAANYMVSPSVSHVGCESGFPILFAAFCLSKRATEFFIALWAVANGLVVCIDVELLIAEIPRSMTRITSSLLDVVYRRVRHDFGSDAIDVLPLECRMMSRAQVAALRWRNRPAAPR